MSTSSYLLFHLLLYISYLANKIVVVVVLDFIRRRRLSVFGHTARLTQGTPAHNALHCQVGLASIWSFTWQGLETSSWSSSRALDRPNLQRHWICSRQPLETGHLTGPWWSDATARAGYAMRTKTMTELTHFRITEKPTRDRLHLRILYYNTGLSHQKRLKLPSSTTQQSFDASSPRTPANILSLPLPYIS